MWLPQRQVGPRREEHGAELATDCLQAERYLDAANGDLQVAAELFYEQSAEQEQASASDTDMAGDDQTTDPTPNPPQQPAPGGGRTLGGAYVPPTEASSSSSSRQQSTQRQAPQQRGVAGLRTLKDLQSSAGGHAHAHDDDDSDDQLNDDENQDFFAGGEKSGLAVQNPNQANPRDHINNILKRARQSVQAANVDLYHANAGQECSPTRRRR